MPPRSTTAGSSSAAPGPGSGSRRSTTSSASSTPRRWSSPTRPGRSASPASWAAPRPRSARARPTSSSNSAIFDPISIRRTAFRYALRSDASLRFEKGQETRLARVGADRTARLIAEWAGGQVAPGVVDSDPSEPAPARVAFRPARVNRLLGTAFDATRAACAARAGRDRDRGGRARDPYPCRRRARDRSTWRRAGRTSSRRSSRPGAAISRSRGTSSRRSSASAATTRSRRPCPTRPCRPSATTRSSCGTPSATPSSEPA